MSDTRCDCYSCEGGDPSMCVACPVHGAWCDWFGEGPNCTPNNGDKQCGARPPWYSPIRSFARCTKPEGHEGDHGYAGCFWHTREVKDHGNA